MTRFIKVLLLLCCCSSADAQQLYVSLRGGMQLSDMEIFPDQPYLSPFLHKTTKIQYNPYTTGFHIGCLFNQHAAVELGLQLGREGYRERFEGNAYNTGVYTIFDWTHQYRYLRIPLTAHYNLFPEDRRFNLGIFAGPRLGILLSQDFSLEGVNQAGTDYVSGLDVEEQAVDQLDLGFYAGLRTQLRLLPRLYVFLDGSFYRGTQDIIEEPLLMNDRFYKRIMNRHYGVVLGLRFNVFSFLKPGSAD